MAFRSPAALAALVLALAPAALGAQGRQSERAFTLNERIPAGQWLRVRNVIVPPSARSCGTAATSGTC